MFRLYTIDVLLHALIAWRLLPEQTSAVAFTATAVWLIASAILIPFALTARRITRQPLSDRLALTGLLALGSFSSLLVLTIVRDVALLGVAGMNALFTLGVSMPALQSSSAAAVPILAALSTLIGFVNARRRARVRSVDVPIADLPAPRCTASPLRRSATCMSARPSSAPMSMRSSTPSMSSRST